MPRVSREQTAANRQTIEEVAARLFREHGIDGVSVADLMGAAGMTHGGFYGHFESKDALAAVACSHAFAQSAQRRERWSRRAPDGTAALREFTERYLSNRHRDDAGQGCPAVALAADVARQAPAAPVRAAYAAGVSSMAGNIARMLGEAGTMPSHAGAAHAADPAVRSAALARMATMVGAVILARATEGDALSAEILAAARAALAGPAESVDSIASAEPARGIDPAPPATRPDTPAS